jgi:hypothetical protein
MIQHRQVLPAPLVRSRVDDAVRRLLFGVVSVAVRPDQDGVTIAAPLEVAGTVHVEALLLLAVNRIGHDAGQRPHVLFGRHLERPGLPRIGGGPRVANTRARRATRTRRTTTLAASPTRDTGLTTARRARAAALTAGSCAAGFAAARPDILTSATRRRTSGPAAGCAARGCAARASASAGAGSSETCSAGRGPTRAAAVHRTGRGPAAARGCAG